MNLTRERGKFGFFLKQLSLFAALPSAFVGCGETKTTSSSEQVVAGVQGVVTGQTVAAAATTSQSTVIPPEVVGYFDHLRMEKGSVWLKGWACSRARGFLGLGWLLAQDLA